MLLIASLLISDNLPYFSRSALVRVRHTLLQLLVLLCQHLYEIRQFSDLTLHAMC